MIEIVGHYNAQTEPSTIMLDEDRVQHWLERGAQPTDQVRKLIKHSRASPRRGGRSRARTDRLVADGRRGPGCASCSRRSRARSSTSRTRVKVEEFAEDDGTVVLELAVAEDDYGKVIGRGGRTANALRTVVKAAAVREDRRVLVDIVD